MSSTASATLATWFKIKGVNYSISSACATSAHCIGNAYELIQWGKQDIMFAGGHEDLDWTMSTCSTRWARCRRTSTTTRPAVASRAYDVNRDGFVIAGGAGVLVLEELEHAKARGAKIYAEIVGYGATSDGYDMVAPSGEGAMRCMRHGAVDGEGAGRLHQPARHLDAGRRLQGNGRIREVFGDRMPPISVDQVADRPFARRGRRAGSDLFAADDEQRLHLRKRPYREPRSGIRGACRSCASASTTPRSIALSNSFGFGGTNATLAMQRYQ
jgi:3-oxoacyl-[acyl-carrier-protein] synthase-1